MLRDALAVLALVALAAWGAHALVLRQGLQRLTEAAGHRLEVEATRLQGELARFDYLPALLETAPPVQTLLAEPRDPLLRAQASAYLHALNAIAGAEMLYVLAPDGLAAAASDDGTPGSPAGRDLSYRPYLQQALAHGRGRFYGIGVTSGVPGYYLSYALPRGGPTQGVATVKIDLRPAEQAWRQMPGQMLALDVHGVVVLASREDWKYRPRGPLDAAAQREATEARRYGTARLTPLAWREGEPLPDTETGAAPALGARRVRVEGEAFVATERTVDEGRWRLVLLSEEAPVQATARWAAASAALAATALLLAALVWRQRRRIVRQQLASRAALQTAHDSLEQRVQARTAELRAAQADLVHAGQLAVLGQMSAGMVHELNQPLAALHTLSDNAVLLLERGRTEDARGNLSRIAQLVARLGKLTGQLKAFAHKRTEPPTPVGVATAVQEALALHAPRLREAALTPQVQITPPTLALLAEEVRLVQVLSNLVGNALDAMAGLDAPLRHLRIEAAPLEDGRMARITVANSGAPIAPEVAARLFEPFFTTKPAGQGLGLGLMISSHLVSSFGGALRLAADNERIAGLPVAFVIELPRASAPALSSAPE